MNWLIENEYIYIYIYKWASFFILVFPKNLGPWKPNTLFLGGDIIHYHLDVRWLQGYQATPFARLIFNIFWKGLVRKLTIWAFLIFFFSSTTFQKKLSCSSFQLKGSWLTKKNVGMYFRILYFGGPFKSSIRFICGSWDSLKGIQIGKEERHELNHENWGSRNRNTLFRGVKRFIIRC